MSRVEMVAEIRRVAWVTDPHLNFVGIRAYENFVGQLADAGVDCVFLTGDISESEDVAWQLRRITSLANKPVYFILGNHDFYRSSIVAVRAEVNLACEQEPLLHYMHTSGPYLLSGGWTLCGDDGWADGRLGDYFGSPVQLNDYQLISDLQTLSSVNRLRRIRRLGAESALRIREQLESARAISNQSIVLTHLPPFREACLYEGRAADDDWAPFFTCHAVGWMLRRFCQRYPQHQILVLCGHTHHEGRIEIMDNLAIWTGEAEYSHPRVNAYLDLSELDPRRDSLVSPTERPSVNDMARDGLAR